MKRFILVMVLLSISINSFCKTFEFKGDIKLLDLVNELQIFYNVKIFAKQQFLERKISYYYKANTIEEHLKKISSLLGTAYYFDKGIYYLDQEEILIKVYDSLNINISNIKGIENISRVGDKVVVTGTKKQIATFDTVIKKITALHELKLKLTVYDVIYKRGSELGISIEKGLKYSFSWESLLKNQCNPLQTLVMSLEASLVAQQNNLNVTQLHNSYHSLVSGKSENIKLGNSFDREIFTSSDEGQKFTSSYEKVESGVYARVQPFYSSENDQWLVDLDFNNSKSTTGDKNNTNFFRVTNKLLFKGSQKFENVLISRINVSSDSKEIVKGIPYLCDIPWVGYLFGVRKKEVYNRVLLLFISKK